MALEGASRAGTILKKTAAGAALSAPAGTQNWSVERLTVDSSGGDGISIVGAWWWTIRDVRVVNFPGTAGGVHVRSGGSSFGSFYGEIDQVMTDGAGIGFWLDGDSPTTNLTTILLSRCEARNGTEGYRVRADLITLLTCDAEEQSARALRLNGHGIKVLGGLIESYSRAQPGSIGIHLEGGNRAMIATMPPEGFTTPYQAPDYSPSPWDAPLAQLGVVGSTVPALTSLRVLTYTGLRFGDGGADGGGIFQSRWRKDNGRAYRYAWLFSGNNTGQKLLLRQLLSGGRDA